MSGYLLSHLLELNAERYPERVAVVDATKTLRYAELDAQTNRLAHLLKDLGVRPGDRVGLFLKKSADAIVGIYAVLKAGATYVPIDPSSPPVRAAYILRNGQIRCLLTGVEKADVWLQLLEAGAPVERFVVLNASGQQVDRAAGSAVVIGVDALQGMSERASRTPAISQDLAYILYTSGSTGQPKGVMLSHRNALAFVEWCFRYFKPTPDDVFSNHAPLHFDLSILDIYVAAMAGAALVIVPHEISMFPVQVAQLIDRHRITIWYSVPSVLSMLVLRGGLTPGRLPSLRHVIFAGEVFPTKYLRELMRLLPHAEFTNLYGPTETNVCTYYRVPPLADHQTEPIPIGSAIEDVEVFAVSESGRLAGVGEEGELHVRGSTVANGYWADPERTARSFPMNPFGPAQDRIYRTGDLVRQAEDGNYVFLGRRDHQIKSRGYRIELGEIEAALYAHPDVLECVAVAIPDDMVGNRIKAIVVARGAGLEAEDLKRACARLLPAYMVPEIFEFQTGLPKTSTGKIDRTAVAEKQGA